MLEGLFQMASADHQAKTATASARASAIAKDGKKRVAGGKINPALVPEESPYSLSFFLRALRNNWLFAVLGLVLGGVLSLVYSKSLTKVYRAAALVEFVPDVINPMGNKDDSARFWGMLVDNREYYETQYALFTSDLVLSRVVREKGLQSDPQFLGYKPEKPIPVEDATAMLRGRVKVEPVKVSRLVTISCEDANPAMAAMLCEAVSRAYVRQNHEKQAKGMTDASDWLSGQLEHFRGELEDTENKLHEFKKSNDLPSSSPEEVSRMVRLDMETYDKALAETRTQKQDYLARYTELSKVGADNPDQLPASELLSNAFLSNLRKQYQDAIRARRELLGEGKGENHPLVKRADETIQQNKTDLLEEVRNIQGSLARDLAVINHREAGQAGLYEGSRRQAVDLNLKELEYHRLDRLRSQNEKLYGMLLDQMKEADMARMMNVETVRVVDPPVVPKVHVRPNVPANVGAGLAVGTFLGLLLAVLREQLDRSVKTPADVETYLGLPFLGLLPAVAEDGELAGGKHRGQKGKEVPKRPRRAPAAGGDRELLVHERPLSAVAEAARSIRTNLLFMNPDKPPKVLLVTSAAPAEGKTTVGCAIAITLAQGGQRVCIVDCDLRRPRLHRIFPAPGAGGVTNVLVGEATIEDVAIPTVVPNLFCIRSGPIPPNPADVLHSEKFREFLAGLGERFDRVIIDSPPVAAVADGTILSTLIDGVVFVVRAFKTTRVLAQQGLRSLLDVDANVVGVVLNAVDLQREHSYYQYYYYKREGYQARPLAEDDQRHVGALALRGDAPGADAENPRRPD